VLAAAARAVSISICNQQQATGLLQHIYLGLKPGGRAAVVVPDMSFSKRALDYASASHSWRYATSIRYFVCRRGFFTAKAYKLMCCFFTRCDININATQTVAYYDMRTASPRYGRKRPLLAADFDEFEPRLFGASELAKTFQVAVGNYYSREEIASGTTT